MTPETLTFADPLLAWLAVPVLLLGSLAIWQWRSLSQLLGRLAKQPVAAPPALRRLTVTWQRTRSLWRIVLATVALLLLVAAVTRPRYGLRETEVANAGIDIAIVVDASKSMLVKDILPNRLQGTALEVGALLGKLAGGRVALVPFAGIAFVQCPLTTDHEVVRTYLQDLRPDDIPVGGTNIGRALALATDVLTGTKERLDAEAKDNLVPQFGGSKNKAIVLFSDGEDHEGAALDAAKKAAEAGIQVFTVGVGSSFGDPVPLLGPDGNAVGVLKDEAGNPVFSKLNLELLQQIAAATGGKSFRYQNKSIAQDLFTALDALEKAEYQARFATVGEERYQWLLGPALLLLLLELVLGNRRRVKSKALRPAKGSPRPAGQVVTAAALLPVLLLGQMWLAVPALATPAWLERENPDVRKGREALQSGDGTAAKAAFAQAQATRPEHAILWYDLALAQAAMSNWDDALQSLQRALSGLQSRDAALEADVHFAIGSTHLLAGQQLVQAAPQTGAAQGKAPAPQAGAQPDPAPGAPGAAEPPAPEGPPKAALDHYVAAVKSLETALLLAPERKDIARNLELARLGAYPPCRSRDKTDEPNDEPKLAKPLDFSQGKEVTKTLRLCPEDRDVYQLALQPGDRLTATVATTTDTGPVEEGTGTGKPELALTLLGPDGQEVLRGPEAGQPPLQAVDLAQVSQPLMAYLDVRNAAEMETPYTLTAKVLPACPRTEDKYEPNNDLASARAVTVGEAVEARLCPLNDDLFRVPLLPGQGLGLKAEAKVDIGANQLTLEVLDPTGKVVAATVPAKMSSLQQTLRMPIALVGGDYAVRVRGGLDTEADYKLEIAVLPPCRDRDDPYEDNDQAIQGNPLTGEMLKSPLAGLQLCPGDDDWYAVELQQGESLFVDLSAGLKDVPDVAPLAGAVTVEVFDEAGTLWGRAVGGAAVAEGALARTVQVLAPPAGTYRVRVTGGGVAAPKFPLPQVDFGAVPVPVPAPAPAPGQAPVPGGDPATAAPAAPEPPKVLLPPGFPTPAVDPAEAKIDLPYNLNLRILPPCPAGNDEQEPNETAAAAKPLEIGQESLLRICKDDHDWLQVTQKAGQALQVTARYDHSPGDLTLLATDEGGQVELAKGETQAPEAAKGSAKADTPAARKGRTAVTGLQLPAPKSDRVVKLHVHAAPGVENFYVLRLEEPPPPSDNGEQQDQSDDNKDEQKDDKQDPKDQKDQKDKQPEPPEQDKKDQEKTEQEKQEQEQRRRQMERGDHNPSNLEAQEALRNSPLRNQAPTKDW